MEVGKYHYPSIHPQRMLTYNHRLIIPSYRTMPLWKKTYKKCFIKPPKEMIDKWYFQNHFQRYPLCMLAVTACNCLSCWNRWSRCSLSSLSCWSCWSVSFFFVSSVVVCDGVSCGVSLCSQMEHSIQNKKFSKSEMF